MNRDKRQMRTATTKFETREENDEMIIEGYFAVFNSNYDICQGATESIAPGAFANTLSGDVRALINHDTTLVIGRTKVGTLMLKEDNHGLWGRVKINPKDQDAVNAWERTKRGDVDQCSFGFEIVDEETDYREDGSVHWTIKEVRLFEVSLCTFPAYEETSVKARERDLEEIKERKAEAWRMSMKKRLKGEKSNGN